MFSKIFTTVKYTLVTVNFLFVITGIVVLSIGSSVQSAYNNYYAFLADRFFSLPAFCIATGIIIFIIASAGFYGAIMENYIMNMGFAGAMVIIFIFQLAACIAGYTLRGNSVAFIQLELTRTMDLYGNSDDKSYEVTKLWDIVQEDFKCCGVTNASDWLPHLNDSIPVSCCVIPPGTVNNFTCDVPVAYKNGCGTEFGQWVSSHAGSIGAAGVFLVLMQALAVAGALWMAKMLREDSINY